MEIFDVFLSLSIISLPKTEQVLEINCQVVGSVVGSTSSYLVFTSDPVANPH